jgi:hypothetical protein
MVNWCSFCKFYIPSKSELSRCIKHTTTAERARLAKCINASTFERNHLGVKYIPATYYNPYILKYVKS